MKNKYHYAIDENGVLIHISEITKENKGGRKFFCPYCGEEMITKLGNIKKHHFSHKNMVEHNSESYLHKLGKLALQKWYNENENIYLVLTQKYKCKFYDNCKVRKGDCVDTIKDIRFDLKRFFGNMEQEVSYKVNENVFIGDIVSFSKDGKNTPLFFEVFVTHKSTDEKIHSSIRIIEFNITSEEDIEEITKTNTITPSNKIKVFNFKTDYVKDDVETKEINVVYDTLKTTTVNCLDLPQHSENSVFSFDVFLWGSTYLNKIPYMIADRFKKKERLWHLMKLYKEMVDIKTNGKEEELYKATLIQKKINYESDVGTMYCFK